MTKTICTIFVGLPATGKSTIIKNLKTEDTWIYSTDMYIESVAEDNGITYSEAFASNIDSAISFNEQKIKTMMKLQKPIIWDQTNLGIGKRAKIIRRAKEAGYIVNCVCVLEPKNEEDIAEWKKRLDNRPGKVIPSHVLANMAESFVVPTIEEGFDSITFYNIWGKELETVK